MQIGFACLYGSKKSNEPRDATCNKGFVHRSTGLGLNSFWVRVYLGALMLLGSDSAVRSCQPLGIT